MPRKNRRAIKRDPGPHVQIFFTDEEERRIVATGLYTPVDISNWRWGRRPMKTADAMHIHIVTGKNLLALLFGTENIEAITAPLRKAFLEGEAKRKAEALRRVEDIAAGKSVKAKNESEIVPGILRKISEGIPRAVGKRPPEVKAALHERG